MVKRIRILFFACRKLDTAAAAQLVLAQNKLQNLVEFNVFRTWVYAERQIGFPRNRIERLASWIAGKRNRLGAIIERRNSNRADRRAFTFTPESFEPGTWLHHVKTIVEKYDQYLLSRDYPVDFRSTPTILVTDIPIADGFFSFTNGPFGIVSTANWKYYFKPASTLDYILTSVQRLALRMLYNQNIGSHFETKGCIWDYCQYQPDARISIFNGYICEECCRKLHSAGLTAEQVNVLQSLAGNQWLGSQSDQYSISGILAKDYRYDLSRSTGPSGSFIKSVSEAIKSDAVQIVRLSIRWALIAALTLLIISSFPSVVSLYKSVREALV